MAKRIVVILLTALAMLFVGNAVALSQSVCGDVDGSGGFIDINDVTALYAYLFVPGTPDPANVAGADMDPFPGVDCKDMTFFCEYIFGGGIPPCTGVDQGSNLVGGQVTLDQVDGLNSSGEIIRQAYAKFQIRATNNTEDMFTAISNGFKVYSPDGATVAIHDFHATDFLAATAFIYATPLGDNDLESWDPDGFGWWSWYPTVQSPFTDAGPGIAAGTSDIAFTVSLEPFGAEDIGKTVCIDSSFYGAGGAWTWQINQESYYVPSWDGPHCFTIADFGPNPPVTMEVLTDTLVTATVEYFDDPHLPGFYLGEVSDLTYAFSASEECGWFDIDKAEGIAPDMIYVEIDTTGLAYGLYFDSILITADNASNSPMYVYVQFNHQDPDPCEYDIEPGDSLIFPSVSVHPCNGIQPVKVKLVNRIAGCMIPIAAPPEITIKDISFEGLVTEDWDLNVFNIHSDSNYVLVGLINTRGLYLDLGETTVFNIIFDYNKAQCGHDERSQYFSWDTTLSDDPSRSLQFAANCSAGKTDPQFDPNRDIMNIGGVKPGDFQADGVVSISDLTGFVDYMFAGGASPFMPIAMDVNEDCVGPDIADLTFVVDFFFAGGEALQCGCVVDAQTSKIVSSMITVSTTYENDRTLVHVNSPIDLRGVHIQFDDSRMSDPAGVYSSALELPHGLTDDHFNVGCLDLNGSTTITAGDNVLFSVAGTHSIASAVVSDMGHQSYLATVASKTEILPHEYALMQNYPNPFNPETVLRFSLAEKTDYKLTVYNVTGQEVAKFTGQGRPGMNEVTFDGSSLASGIYLYRLNAGSYAASKKMMLLK